MHEISDPTPLRRRPNQSLKMVIGHSMDPKWNEDLPIYRQLRDRVVAMILEGVLGDGDALPSVRNVAAEYRLNPLTVLKGYQELVDEDLVEKKRGRGMYVTAGARKQLMKDERSRFLNKEWPIVAATIVRLQLDKATLLDAIKDSEKEDSGDKDE
jgi:GntR family transcriptional regulator